MSFRFCESMITHYWQQGYVVFRRVLPATLVRDLRIEADKARALAHELHGPQAQRLQPIVKYADRINNKPFEEYAQLPVLCDAIQRLLGPSAPGGTYRHADLSVLGLLVEPVGRPRHHGWHRDWVSNYPLAEQKSPARLAEFAATWNHTTKGNQVNCAIYPDACLWYVPGSYMRYYDLPGEAQDFCYCTGTNPVDQMQASHAEIERVALEKCYAFPNAQRLHLDAGDYAVYRSYGWHTGAYSPSQPRATIHDTVKYVPAAASAVGA